MRLILSVLLSLHQPQPCPSALDERDPLLAPCSARKPVSQSAPVQMAFAVHRHHGLDAGRRTRRPSPIGCVSRGDVVAQTTIPVQVRNGRFLVHLGEDGQTALGLCV